MEKFVLKPDVVLTAVIPVLRQDGEAGELPQV